MEQKKRFDPLAFHLEDYNTPTPFAIKAPRHIDELFAKKVFDNTKDLWLFVDPRVCGIAVDWGKVVESRKGKPITCPRWIDTKSMPLKWNGKGNWNDYRKNLDEAMLVDNTVEGEIYLGLHEIGLKNISNDQLHGLLYAVSGQRYLTGLVMCLISPTCLLGCISGENTAPNKVKFKAIDIATQTGDIKPVMSIAKLHEDQIEKMTKKQAVEHLRTLEGIAFEHLDTIAVTYGTNFANEYAEQKIKAMDLVSQIARLNIEKAEAEQGIERSSKSLLATQTECFAKLAELEQLGARCDEMKEELNNVQSECARATVAYQKELQAIGSSTWEAKAALNAQNDKVAEKQAICDHLTSVIDQNNEVIMGQNSKIQQLSQVIEDLNTQCADTGKELKKRQKAVAKITTKSGTSAEFSQMKTQIEELIAANVKCKAETETLKASHTEKVNSMTAEWKAKYSTLQEQATKLDMYIDKIEHENMQLIRENEALKKAEDRYNMHQRSKPAIGYQQRQDQLQVKREKVKPGPNTPTKHLQPETQSKKEENLYEQRKASREVLMGKEDRKTAIQLVSDVVFSMKETMNLDDKSFSELKRCLIHVIAQNINNCVRNFPGFEEKFDDVKLRVDIYRLVKNDFHRRNILT